jgi:hypothetical protein
MIMKKETALERKDSSESETDAVTTVVAQERKMHKQNQAQLPAFTSRTNCLCFEIKSSHESFENPA